MVARLSRANSYTAPMAGGRDYDDTKLGELILYVADKSLGDARFGKTKLNKMLFWSDFMAYQRTGSSITGAVYQHLPQGPCPHQLVPVLNGLRASGAAIVRGEATFAGTQQRVVATRDADLNSFSGAEIAIVDSVIEGLRKLTNQQASELSHKTKAWLLTEEGQEIPYGAALLSSDQPSADDVAWLEEVTSGHAGVEAL